MTGQKVHPFLLFWIGILTGAIIVGLIFLYRLYGGTGETNILRATPRFTPVTTTTLQNSVNTVTPQDLVKAGDPEPW